MKDSCSKRLNVLIHELKEAPAKLGEENFGQSRAETLVMTKIRFTTRCSFEILQPPRSQSLHRKTQPKCLHH